MMPNLKSYRQGYASLVSLILVVVIISILGYLYLGPRKNSTFDSESKELMSSGVDTTSHQTILNSAVRDIKAVEKQMFKQRDEIEGMLSPNQ